VLAKEDLEGLRRPLDQHGGHSLDQFERVDVDSCAASRAGATSLRNRAVEAAATLATAPASTRT
jgi:hypothetical protein